LRLACPCRRKYWLTTFHLFNKNGLDPAFSTGSGNVRVLLLKKKKQPTTCRFGPSLSAPLAC
jgi:hypothetical protein